MARCSLVRVATEKLVVLRGSLRPRECGGHVRQFPAVRKQRAFVAGHILDSAVGVLMKKGDALIGREKRIDQITICSTLAHAFFHVLIYSLHQSTSSFGV